MEHGGVCSLERSRELGNPINVRRAGYNGPVHRLPRFTHIVAPALALMLLPAKGPDNRDVDSPSRVARLSFTSESVSKPRRGEQSDTTRAKQPD